MTPGVTLWFTGLSGAGKSTIADEVERVLAARGERVQRLDGDLLREKLCKDLGFSREDRDRNIERASYVAGLLARHGVIVLASFISPFRAQRAAAHRTAGEHGAFYEVWVRSRIETCIRRDPKGLYKKAIAGEIPQFTGISQVYQEPDEPDLVLDTDAEDAATCARRVIGFLADRGLLASWGRSAGNGIPDEQEREAIRAKLEALGYI